MSRRFKATDYFDLLKVGRDATKEDLQKAFMQQAAIWHPDKAEKEEDVELHTRVYQDLQDAYRILSCDSTRKQYIDAQQTTDIEFLREERDTGYVDTNQYKTEDGKFDKEAFERAFNESRDAVQADAIQQFMENPTVKQGTVTQSDLEDLMKRRAEETVQIDKVFNPQEFNQATFNRAFDLMKAREPGNAVEEYHGDPMAMFSSGGLAETDTMSGLQFNNGTDFTANPVDNMVKGFSNNPTAGSLDLDALNTGEAYGTEEKLSGADMERLLLQRQQQGHDLANIEFINEPSDIEKQFPDLFAPMQVEGLDAPLVPDN